MMNLRERRQERGEYFTEDWLSTALINNVGVSKPCSLVDLGAGKGSLLAAAKSRWESLYGLTVEVDKSNFEYLSRTFPDAKHLQLDVLDSRFPQKFLSHGGNQNSDLIVSNPPYKKIQWDSNVSEILDFLGLNKILEPAKSINAEILFLIQALKIFNSGTEVAAIVPDYIMTAERAKPIRKALAKYFGIYKIAEVPEKAFLGTDVKTHLIFLKLGGVSPTQIQISSLSRTTEEPIRISSEDLFDRGDYSFYRSNLNKQLQSLNLSDIATVHRGNLPMYIAKSKGLKPFHTTDFKMNDETVRVLKSKEYSHRDEFRSAITGDILLGRVGRNASRQIIMLKKGSANISDCVFAIRLNHGTDFLRKSLIKQLLSTSGQLWLQGRMKGSGAKSISLKEILEFPLVIED